MAMVETNNSLHVRDGLRVCVKSINYRLAGARVNPIGVIVLNIKSELWWILERKERGMYHIAKVNSWMAPSGRDFIQT